MIGRQLLDPKWVNSPHQKGRGITGITHDSWDEPLIPQNTTNAIQHQYHQLIIIPNFGCLNYHVYLPSVENIAIYPDIYIYISYMFITITITMVYYQVYPCFLSMFPKTGVAILTHSIFRILHDQPSSSWGSIAYGTVQVIGYPDYMALRGILIK